MIALHTKVRLAPKARLRFDAPSGKHMLLYPERGLELTDSAARVVKLCAGSARAAREIVDALAAGVEDTPREQIEREVLAFLRQLEERGLLQIGDAS
jgi:coenzyme PQQ biosynthesis protein PqqD